MTDDELRDRLFAADPTFADRLAKSEERIRRFDEESAPIRHDLMAVGVRVDNITDLRRPAAPIRKAIPVLVRWLPRLPDSPVKRDVIMSLGDKRCGPEASLALIAEFQRMDPLTDVTLPTSVRSDIGSALRTVATDAVFDQLVDVVNDYRHGEHRALVVLTMANMKKNRDRSVTTLLCLLDDDTVADVAIMALTKLRAAEAHDRIAAMRDHPSALVREQVRVALKKLGASRS